MPAPTVVTRNLVVSPRWSTFDGSAVSVFIKVECDTDFYVPTGTPGMLLSFPKVESLETSTNDDYVVALPVTDQVGLQDGEGRILTDWLYRVTVLYLSSSGAVKKRLSKVFAFPADDDSAVRFEELVVLS